jgi:hypothetical protein
MSGDISLDYKTDAELQNYTENVRRMVQAFAFAASVAVCGLWRAHGGRRAIERAPPSSERGTSSGERSAGHSDHLHPTPGRPGGRCFCAGRLYRTWRTERTGRLRWMGR